MDVDMRDLAGDIEKFYCAVTLRLLKRIDWYRARAKAWKKVAKARAAHFAPAAQTAVAPARERQLAGDWEPVSPDDAPRACWFNDQCPRPARYKRKGLLAGCCDVHAEARGVFAPPAVAGDGPCPMTYRSNGILVAKCKRQRHDGDGPCDWEPPAPSPAAVVEPNDQEGSMTMSDVVEACKSVPGIEVESGPYGVRIGTTGWRLERGGGIAGNAGEWWLRTIAGAYTPGSPDHTAAPIGPIKTKSDLIAALKKKWRTQIANATLNQPAHPPSAPTGEAQGAVTHAEAREALRVVRFVTTGAALAPEASRSLIERYIDAQEARERAEFEKQLNHDCRDNVPTYYAQRTVIERLEADLAAARQEAEELKAECDMNEKHADERIEETETACAEVARLQDDLADARETAEALRAELAARKQADDDVIDQRDQLLRDCEALRAEVARLTNPFPHTFGCRCANCTAKTFQPAPATPATGANAGLARDFWNGDGGLDDLTKLLDEVTAAAEARGRTGALEDAVGVVLQETQCGLSGPPCIPMNGHDRCIAGREAADAIRALAAESASKGGR